MSVAPRRSTATLTGCELALPTRSSLSCREDERLLYSGLHPVIRPQIHPVGEKEALTPALYGTQAQRCTQFNCPSLAPVGGLMLVSV